MTNIVRPLTIKFTSIETFLYAFRVFRFCFQSMNVNESRLLNQSSKGAANPLISTHYTELENSICLKNESKKKRRNQIDRYLLQQSMKT